MEDQFISPPRTPPHLFRAGSAYFITGKCLHGQPMLSEPLRRQQLIDSLKWSCEQYNWELIAWVVLSNHYHCILQAPADDASTLSALLTSVHKYTARIWNEADRLPGRTVWYRYWDTCLSHAGSFYARLNYIHYNPVKHELCAYPEEYAFSSYHIWLTRDDVNLGHLESVYAWNLLDLE